MTVGVLKNFGQLIRQTFNHEHNWTVKLERLFRILKFQITTLYGVSAQHPQTTNRQIFFVFVDNNRNVNILIFGQKVKESVNSL